MTPDPIFKGTVMKRFYILLAFVLIATAGLTVAAQSPQVSFTPVTDEMLWKPSPNDWLTWRRTLDSWGYSPLNEIDRNNVSRLKMIVVARHRQRPHAGGDAARLQRHDVHPQPRRHHHGDGRPDR